MIINKYSNPEKALRKAKEYLGNEVIMRLSTRKEKKYMIQDDEGKWIHFGQMGYEDYTKHNNDTRRANYRRRAINIGGDWKSNKYSPNNLAINILW